MWFDIWQSHKGADLVLRQQVLWAGWLVVCATWDAKFLCAFSSKPLPPPAPLWGGSFFFSFLLSSFLPFYLGAINRFVSWSLCRVSALKTTSHLLVTERMWGMRPHGPSLPPSQAVFVHAVEREQGACSPWEQTLTLQALLGGRQRRGGSGMCGGWRWALSGYLSISLHWKILVGSASSNIAI